MTNKDGLIRLAEKCDIHFEDALISKEKIIETYADFFAAEVSGESRSVSIALHTGSICFEVVSFIIAALGCVIHDDTCANEVIMSLAHGDIVLYKNTKYRWLGIELLNGQQRIKLQQDARGKDGPATLSIPYETNKGLVRPYFGESNITDSRGLRSSTEERIEFISHMFDIPKGDVPSITGASVIIVTEKESFERIAKGLELRYGGYQSVGLLDIVTASYYTDSGESYRYGGNAAKTEPVLKITSNISTARKLALDKRGNKAVGLMVMGAKAVSRGGSELTDLLGREALKFVHVATDMDFEGAEDIVESQSDAAIFACTKEFLLNNALPVQKLNVLTSELDRQVENILNSTITPISIDGGCSWDEIRTAKEALYAIKRSDLDERVKKDFIIVAHSLLNLLTTAVFPLRDLENAVSDRMLNSGVISPVARINELWDLADMSGSMEYNCAIVAEIIERLYKSLSKQCPKYDALLERITSDTRRQVAVIVPKAYYIDILSRDRYISRSGVTVVTANRFDASVVYDEIIAVGDIAGKRFDPLRCRAAEKIVVFLYDCETNMFKYRSEKVSKFEKKLNIRGQVFDDETHDGDFGIQDKAPVDDNIDSYVKDETDLEHYIDNISIFDIKKFASGMSAMNENTPTAEVYAIGKLMDGGQILFSRYYSAVIFDASQGAVTETAPEKLDAGDILIFAKRDDYTRNMVDYIYEGLLSGDKLSKEVAEATEKAFYWKEALREHKELNRLSYRGISEELRRLGSSIQEASVRHWLIEDSHIVGPRDLRTLELIAELTGDPYLLNDTQAYHEACRVVRRQRKEILKLIGKAITNKLTGHFRSDDSLLETVYDNIEKLSESHELASITILDESLLAPINIVNRPFINAEVSI